MPVTLGFGAALPGCIYDNFHHHGGWHHQSVDALGEGLTPVAWTEDGTVEAAELAGARFLVAVQGHPEVGEDRRLFEGLVVAAASR